MSSVPESKSNTVPLAVGLTLGLFAIVTAILGGIWYLNRRGQKRSTDLDAHLPSPYAVPPVTQANQQSDLSREHKRHPQPTRQPGAPMVTGDTIISFGVTEFGPPPSYETRREGGQENNS